jgi:hypothetical protein
VNQSVNPRLCLFPFSISTLLFVFCFFLLFYSW